jgi:hypothetical protein
MFLLLQFPALLLHTKLIQLQVTLRSSLQPDLPLEALLLKCLLLFLLPGPSCLLFMLCYQPLHILPVWQHTSTPCRRVKCRKQRAQPQ